MNGQGKKLEKLCSFTFLIDVSFNKSTTLSFIVSPSVTRGIGDLFQPISQDTNNMLLNMKVLNFLTFY